MVGSGSTEVFFSLQSHIPETRCNWFLYQGDQLRHFSVRDFTLTLCHHQATDLTSAKFENWGSGNGLLAHVSPQKPNMSQKCFQDLLWIIANVDACFDSNPVPCVILCPIPQLASRWRSRWFGFTFRELSCRPFSHTVYGWRVSVLLDNGFLQRRHICVPLRDCLHFLLQEAPVVFRVPLHGWWREPSPWCSAALLSTDGYTSFCLTSRGWARLPVPPGSLQGPWNLTGRDQRPLAESSGAEEQSERESTEQVSCSWRSHR